MGKVREKNVGQLFANMAPIDIPAEQAKIRAQQQKIDARQQEIDVQKQELSAKLQEVALIKQEMEAALALLKKTSSEK